MSCWKEAANRSLLRAKRVKDSAEAEHVLASWLLPLAEAGQPFHQALLPGGSAPPEQSLPRGTSHLPSFSRSPFSWAHQSARGIFKDVPGAGEQRLGTFAACELEPVFS